MDLSTEVKSPPCVSSVDYTVVHPLTSVMDTTDSSVKLQNTHPSHAHHHYNLSRAMFLRRSCHKYGNRYSWRNSGCHADTLSTLCKGASPLCDEKLSFKFASRCSSESGYHGDRRPFHRPERISSIPLAMTALSPDAVKMVCGICLKLLRHKAYALGNPLLSSDLSVAAILVCGHVYHADCLEQRTSEADRWDPPCPLCVEWPSKVDASRGQE
ncbi:uncharacterized protein LOC122666926 isoform X1 [Telopea speciosissima]|uniref:uncharacterized protein LOC122666926 isoform X1 n=1 Tax=Telopea speciosissima TaxID=54955 RepID=UPI001CC7429C|nr:uncharacterized protein LOC122666926 isoform X1 [Telopea speciosissima]XP_043718975.1 uncharacterized protein LOC122666926 isoform X1 [Telopea speciosissima]